MSKLHGYTEREKELIKALMFRLVEGRIDSGEIEETDEAIKSAMPLALADRARTSVASDASRRSF